MTIDVILNIIYFLLSLTVLVSIHELGHLSMAKLFGVYCEEYSIGFGPQIVSIAPKGFNRKGQLHRKQLQRAHPHRACIYALRAYRLRFGKDGAESGDTF